MSFPLKEQAFHYLQSLVDNLHIAPDLVRVCSTISHIHLHLNNFELQLRTQHSLIRKFPLVLLVSIFTYFNFQERRSALILISQSWYQAFTSQYATPIL